MHRFANHPHIIPDFLRLSFVIIARVRLAKSAFPRSPSHCFQTLIPTATTFEMSTTEQQRLGVRALRKSFNDLLLAVVVDP